MSYYRVCPRCGDHLDPGEICGCKEDATQRRREELAERIAALTPEQFDLLLELYAAETMRAGA